mgnify:CR=1 FL=1|jgi:hypothetical protein
MKKTEHSPSKATSPNRSRQQTDHDESLNEKKKITEAKLSNAFVNTPKKDISRVKALN